MLASFLYKIRIPIHNSRTPLYERSHFLPGSGSRFFSNLKISTTGGFAIHELNVCKLRAGRSGASASFISLSFQMFLFLHSFFSLSLLLFAARSSELSVCAVLVGFIVVIFSPPSRFSLVFISLSSPKLQRGRSAVVSLQR